MAENIQGEAERKIEEQRRVAAREVVAEESRVKAQAEAAYNQWALALAVKDKEAREARQAEADL
eukprot:6450319-Prorocentrum_lima.AAC.1